MKIIIGADVVATENNIDDFKNANIENLIGKELMEEWESSDIRIFNIEGPITDRCNPIIKNGPHLRMGRDVMPGIKSLNPTVVTLANNHIMDQGEIGITETIRLLKEYGIDYTGIGQNAESAAKTFVIENGELKIGIYACSETEFSVKSEGITANGYNPLRTYDDIKKSKENCDYLIVLYHGGRECYRLPTPQLQDRFKKMASEGADAVIAQHTHCVGGYEILDRALLVYGQGNFIFGLKDDEYWNSGLLIEIDIEKKDINYKFIPITKKDGRIRKAEGIRENEIMKGFYERSQSITRAGFINDQYGKYADEQLEIMLRSVGKESLVFRLLNRIVGGGLVFKKYKKAELVRLLNYIECESHRELLIAGLKRRINQFLEV